MRIGEDQNMRRRRGPRPSQTRDMHQPKPQPEPRGRALSKTRQQRTAPAPAARRPASSGLLERPSLNNLVFGARVCEYAWTCLSVERTVRAPLTNGSAYGFGQLTGLRWRSWIPGLKRILPRSPPRMCAKGTTNTIILNTK